MRVKAIVVLTVVLSLLALSGCSPESRKSFRDLHDSMKKDVSKVGHKAGSDLKKVGSKADRDMKQLDRKLNEDQ